MPLPHSYFLKVLSSTYPCHFCHAISMPHTLLIYFCQKCWQDNEDSFYPVSEHRLNCFSMLPFPCSTNDHQMHQQTLAQIIPRQLEGTHSRQKQVMMQERLKPTLDISECFYLYRILVHVFMLSNFLIISLEGGLKF